MPCGHAATALPDREARAQIPRPPTNSEFGTEFSEAARSHRITARSQILGDVPNQERSLFLSVGRLNLFPQTRLGGEGGTVTHQ